MLFRSDSSRSARRLFVAKDSRSWSRLRVVDMARVCLKEKESGSDGAGNGRLRRGLGGRSFSMAIQCRFAELSWPSATGFGECWRRIGRRPSDLTDDLWARLPRAHPRSLAIPLPASSFITTPNYRRRTLILPPLPPPPSRLLSSLHSFLSPSPPPPPSFRPPSLLDPDSRTDTRWAKGPVSPASARSVEQSEHRASSPSAPSTSSTRRRGYEVLVACAAPHSFEPTLSSCVTPVATVLDQPLPLPPERPLIPPSLISRPKVSSAAAGNLPHRTQRQGARTSQRPSGARRRRSQQRQPRGRRSSTPFVERSDPYRPQSARRDSDRP